MTLKSGIQWTDATWNPSTGCSKVSPGCKNCYAEALSRRLRAMGQPKYRNGFEYTEHPSSADLPLKWKKPRRIFVNSMSDLFHEEADAAFVMRCFDVMIKADWHVYQILTKRPRSMAEFSRRFAECSGRAIPRHVWMGTSVESQDYLHRMDDLRRVRCQTRFVSFEPLLGPVIRPNLSKIDWAIIGGECGPGFRQVRKEWVVGLISQCRRQGVPIFFKQWGGHRPNSGGRQVDGTQYNEYPGQAGSGTAPQGRPPHPASER